MTGAPGEVVEDLGLGSNVHADRNGVADRDHEEPEIEDEDKRKDGQDQDRVSQARYSELGGVPWVWMQASHVMREMPRAILTTTQSTADRMRARFSAPSRRAQDRSHGRFHSSISMSPRSLL
jgi:hypothetical protein